MKHIACLLFALLSMGFTKAQVAHWLVPPQHDWIDLPAGSNIIVARQGADYTLWNYEGKCVENVKGNLFPYHEGHAIAIEPGTTTLVAIYDADGNKKSVEDKNLQLGSDDTIFKSGYLLVHNGEYFFYMDATGEIKSQPFIRAYPFSKGYASCFTYENLDRMKKPLYQLIDKDLQSAPMVWQGKQFKPNDIELISSVNDEGIAIVAAKGKLFYFNVDNRELTPILPSAEDTNVKNQARYPGEIENSFIVINDTTAILTARCGKNLANITFNTKTFTPIRVNIGKEERVFKREAIAAVEEPSPLCAVRDSISNLTALYIGNKEVLPDQFDEIRCCIGDKAIASINDKFGLLQVNANDDFIFRLNNDQAIGFRHKNYSSTIRLDMPTYIDSEDAHIEIDSSTGCLIDKVSKSVKNTAEGNCIVYNCLLTCPHDIGDTPELIGYPAYIAYQGLRTPMKIVGGKAWHSKYYNVDINDHDISINSDTITFVINVSADRLPGEDVYHFIPTLVTDSLDYKIDKVSDMRYKCKVYNVKEGQNNIIVQIKEEGCPPADYDFELEYIKPTAKSQDNVTIVRKKKKPVVKPTPVLQF